MRRKMEARSVTLRDPVKFLLVDDVPENLVALEGLLRRDGLQIMTARSGMEALELLLVNDFALALLDVQLPTMDGFELAEIMRGTSRTRCVPIIFLTAVATDERRRFLGYESGAVDYLIKPIDPHVLRRKAEVFFELDQQRRELVRQRDEMSESEERFRRSVVQAPTPMMLFDDQGHVLVVNDEWKSLSGYEQAEIATIGDWARRAHGDNADLVLAHLQNAIAGPDRVRAEFDLTTKGGDKITWDLLASAVGRTTDGQNLYLWVAHDITARKQAERTQQLLMGELNHRVKNTLATVQAIAQQTLRFSCDPARFAASFKGRLQALSRAHSMLSDATWKGADVSELIHDQMSLGAIDERRITISGSPVSLKPQQALHVALMLHELTTNANKYGALAHAEGAISVSWKVQDGQLHISWTERCGLPLKTPEHRGFGTTLIEQTARADGGDAVVEYSESGVAWQISLPLLSDYGERQAQTTPRPVKRTTRDLSTESNQSVLAGKRILVVEDEPLVALDMIASLEGVAAQVAGPASTAEEALDIIASTALDGALLDGNLHGLPVDVIATALTKKNIPFIFVTGYGRESLPLGFNSIEILGKPFTADQLLKAAIHVTHRSRQSAGDSSQANGMHVMQNP
jgi:PAS domain S-box-containing protein